jgi:hypothetical protein
MSNLKYKLLLCVVAVMVLTVPLYAAQVQIWSWNFDGTDPAEDWTFSAGSDWAVGPPGGAGGDPAAAASSPNVLGNNLAGLYANGIASPEYAVSPEIDCSDQVGVKLRFDRWLTVEDNMNDQAYVQVSANGTDWTTVWENPSEYDADADDYVADLVDTIWNTVEYDISEVADGEAAVQIRWALSSNGSTQFGGWNVDNIEIWASAPDAVYDYGDAAGWTLDPNWEVGAAASTVGSSGQWEDTSDPPDAVPDAWVGADPADDAAGVAGGTILGYNIDGNYEASMTAKYATSPLFDCTGLVGTAIRFDRYLEVGDGAYDKASIQVHVDPDPDVAGIDAEEFYSDDTEVGLSESTDNYVWEVNTSEFYENDFSVEYVVAGLGSGESIKISYATTNEEGTTWNVVVTDTTNTAADTTETVYSPAPLPVPYSDGVLYIKAELANLAEDSDATATISAVAVEGISWKYVWQNPAADPLTRTLDEEWSTQFVSLDADGAEEVAVRFAMGPTDAFAASKYGGWSIDNIAIVEGSREFRSAGVEADTALTWEEEGDIVVSLQNTGTGTWDSEHSAYTVLARTQEIADPGNPGEDLTVKVNQDLAIDRWGIPSIAVGDGDTVAPDDIYEFADTITAPPLSSIVYAVPVSVTAPPDGPLSKLGADWALANETALGLEFAPSYMNEGPASAGIVITRFPDDQPGTDGDWARPWIEELAAGVPFVVQGYPNGTYRPLVTVDRAAIAVYIQRAAHVPTSPAAPGSVFHDVPDDHWAVNEIQAVYAVGIVQGYPDATYHPQALVTRDQMCKFIVNGVNYAHAGAITVPTLASLDSQAAQDAYPFGDVDCYNDTEDVDPQVDERNVLANYILAAYNTDIVQGYPVPEGSEEGTKPNFKPAVTITRDQLAVFVWRGFMRDYASLVALGGPGITQAVLADDLTPTTGGLAAYSGFTSLTDIIQNDDDATAYVTLDALRLNGSGDPVVVTFALIEGANPLAPQTVTVSWGTINGAISTILSTNVNTDTDGEPYMTIAYPLPIASVNHGTYKLVTTVNGVELSRMPTLRIMSQMYLDTMEGAFSYPWNVSGQPAPPLNFYGTGPDAADETDADLKDGTASLELQGTQSIQRVFSTLGRHDIRLSADLAGVDFADDDTITVSWSKDAGAHWITAFVVTGADIPDALDTFTANLPNGLQWTDPDAWADLTAEEQADIANWGADNNSNFAVKITIDGSTDARGYVDNVEIRGT